MEHGLLLREAQLPQATCRLGDEQLFAVRVIVVAPFHFGSHLVAGTPVEELIVLILVVVGLSLLGCGVNGGKSGRGRNWRGEGRGEHCGLDHKRRGLRVEQGLRVEGHAEAGTHRRLLLDDGASKQAAVGHCGILVARTIEMVGLFLCLRHMAVGRDYAHQQLGRTSAAASKSCERRGHAHGQLLRLFYGSVVGQWTDGEQHKAVPPVEERVAALVLG